MRRRAQLLLLLPFAARNTAGTGADVPADEETVLMEAEQRQLSGGSEVVLG